MAQEEKMKRNEKGTNFAGSVGAIDSVEKFLGNKGFPGPRSWTGLL